MLRIVLYTVPRVGRSYEHFPDGFELHLLPAQVQVVLKAKPEADISAEEEAPKAADITSEAEASV